METEISVIGGGLSGCEAAWQAAEAGVKVRLHEMRPQKMTAAHISGNLAEVVCSNSFGSNLVDRASGVLKDELRRLGSLLLHCAEKTAVPAGRALAVDREKFSDLVTETIYQHPNIRVIREEITALPEGITVVASGPLTSESLTQEIKKLTGEENLFFFDAIAPIIESESLKMDVAFRRSRYQDEDDDRGDYINCPMDKESYLNFINELVHAERISLQPFEEAVRSGVRAGIHRYFEGCLPVEILAERDVQALSFGPMRPVGLSYSGTRTRPYAVVQLRQDNLAGELYNMVGFQTNLTFSEQKRVFRLIPGMENAEFIRYGQMHRNTFINSPRLVASTLQLKIHPDIFFAGQITGVEGYVGNIATGLLAGRNASRLLLGKELVPFPLTTMIGSLINYITHAEPDKFQPMKANFGLLLPIKVDGKIGKREKGMLYHDQALADLDDFIRQNDY